MNRKTAMLAAIMLAVISVLSTSASAMHISEGMLPKPWAFGWMAVCVPFVVAGFYSIKKKVELTPKAKILLAMCGAFAFVLSALKMPAFTGTCSHPRAWGLAQYSLDPRQQQ